MSRPYSILLALGMVGAMAGCHHTHGVCDCELEPLAPHGGPVLLPGSPPPLLRPEPLQAMPKAAETPAPAPAPTETPK